MMVATNGNGRGTWLVRNTNDTEQVDNEKIVFETPTNSIDTNTQYQADLTWQLTEKPDANVQ